MIKYRLLIIGVHTEEEYQMLKGLMSKCGKVLKFRLCMANAVIVTFANKKSMLEALNYNGGVFTESRKEKS